MRRPLKALEDTLELLDVEESQPPESESEPGHHIEPNF